MNTLAPLHKVHLKIQFGAVESGADRGSDEVKDWESEGVGSRESFLSFIMKPIHNPFIWDTGEKLHGAFLSITNQTNYPELSWRTEIYSVFYHVPSAYIQQTTTGYIRYLQDCRCFKYSQHPELSKKVKHNHTKVNERHLKYQKIEIKKKKQKVLLLKVPKHQNSVWYSIINLNLMWCCMVLHHQGDKYSFVLRTTNEIELFL